MIFTDNCAFMWQCTPEKNNVSARSALLRGVVSKCFSAMMCQDIYFAVALRPNAGHGLVILEVF